MQGTGHGCGKDTEVLETTATRLTACESDAGLDRPTARPSRPARERALPARRTLLRLLAAVALAPGLRGAGPAQDGPALRVLVVETGADDADAQRAVWTSRIEGLAEARTSRLAPAGLDGDALEGVDVVVLAAATLPPEPALRALAASVTSRGLGLVVCKPAAGAAASDATLSALIGAALRATEDGERAEEAEEGGAELLVAIEDQSHPITQCLTPFRHRGAPPAVRLRDQVRPLASGIRAGAAEREERRLPLVWTRREGAGVVVGTMLDVSGGPSAGAAVTILRRAVEWCGRRAVSEKLDGPLELAPRAFEREGYFLGREIAAVMSYRGADWLTRPDREEEERPEAVLDALELTAGQTVADLGAGNGYFTLRMARRVGPSGRVLAVDIQKEMLALLEKRGRAARLDNIETVLAKDDDPGLPAGKVDLVLMVDVYHELSAPRAVMSKLRAALAPNGRIALVEYRGEDPRVPIKPLHRMTLAQVRVEMESLSLRIAAVHEFLPHQRIIVCVSEEGGNGR